MSGHISMEELVSRFLSGEIDQESLHSLEAILETDPAARGYLRRMANLDGGLRDWAEVGMARAAWADARVGESKREGGEVLSINRGAGWSRWPMAAAISFGGILLGFLSSSLVFARSLAQREPVALILPVSNGDFASEEPPGQDGPPMGFGKWGGDFSRVTGVDQGISPAKGKRMLQFLRADNTGSPKGNNNRASEIWQLVDLRPLRGKLGERPVRVEVSGRFNSAPLAEGLRISFGVGAYAFDGTSLDSGALWNQRKQIGMAEVVKSQQSDRDPSTWQRVSAELVVPPEATELLLYFQASVWPLPLDSEGPFVFPGQYLTDVSLRLLKDQPNTEP